MLTLPDVGVPHRRYSLNYKLDSFMFTEGIKTCASGNLIVTIQEICRSLYSYIWAVSLPRFL